MTEVTGPNRTILVIIKGMLIRTEVYFKLELIFYRPFAMKIDNQQLDFESCFAALEAELDRIPFEGDRSNQPLFYRPVVNPEPGAKLFHDSLMGQNTFDSLLRRAAWASGLFLRPLQCHNQSLRVTVFNLHRSLGIAPEGTTDIVGHSSLKTQNIYKRNRMAHTGSINAAVQSSFTGSNIIYAEDSSVKLLNGQCVHVNVPMQSLPLRAMPVDEYYLHVPAGES